MQKSGYVFTNGAMQHYVCGRYGAYYETLELAQQRASNPVCPTCGWELEVQPECHTLTTRIGEGHDVQWLYSDMHITKKDGSVLVHKDYDKTMIIPEHLNGRLAIVLILSKMLKGSTIATLFLFESD